MLILKPLLIGCNLQLAILLGNNYDFVDDFLQLALAVGLLLNS